MSQQENSVKKMINVLKRSRTRTKSDHFEIPTIEINSIDEEVATAEEIVIGY